ncbi:MAG: hypothetical protein LBV19_06015 [Streptococcaceae bacterium]|nr:hypothetical protein [Streptococcaceae bacterium]
MNILAQDILRIITHIFNPGNLTILVILSGAFFKAWNAVTKKITEELENKFNELDQRLNTIELQMSGDYNELQKEVLRLQILEGINSRRLSSSELLYFADKYHKLGGNSFVSKQINEFLNHQKLIETEKEE